MITLLLLLPFAEAKKPKIVEPPPVEEVASALVGRATLSDTAWNDLVWLCDRIGARFNGSPELDAAIAWGGERMRAYGLANVHTEAVELPGWHRGEIEAALVGPVKRDLHALALGGSVGTPPEGIEAEIVVVGSFDELTALGEAVRGKIVVYDVPWAGYGDTVKYRFAGATAASKQGAVGVLVRSITSESLDSPHTGAMGYGDAPPIPAAALTVEDAALLRRLAAGGEAPRVRMRLTSEAVPPVPSANVMGEVIGRDKPDEIVVLGCHIDSWDVGQGAQDDGAGCVTVLAAAALIQQLPVKPRRTVRVVFYTGEEFGIGGGKGYATAHADEAGRTFAAVEADTGAGRPLGFRVDVRAPGDADGEAAVAAMAKLAPLVDLLEPLDAASLEIGWSGADIGPMVELGVPGLGLSQDMSGYWPIHHTEADTVDKIDPKLLARNVAVMAVAAYWLADTDVELRPPPAVALP